MRNPKTTTLQVIDFAGWKAVFDSYGGAREEAGVMRVHIARQLDDPDFVIVDLGFESAEEARSYLEFLRRNVWMPDAYTSVATLSPEARVLQAVFDSEVAAPKPQWGLSA